MEQTVWKYTPPYDDLIGGPGNRILLKGTMEAGWFGEVKASELFTGDKLAALIGLTDGTSQYSNESWLKFAYEGDVLFIAKKPFRYNLFWNSINKANAVYGDRIIRKNNRKYAIMLPRGTGKDIQTDPKKGINGYAGTVNHNSMWNVLMLPIHQKAPSEWVFPNNVKSPTENWNVGYTDADLITSYKNGNGSNCWCQETVSNGHLIRGGNGVSDSYKYESYRFSTDIGWRPVLKLIG